MYVYEACLDLTYGCAHLFKSQFTLENAGHLMQRVDFIGKESDAGRDWGQEEKGTTEDEMAGWHH